MTTLPYAALAAALLACAALPAAHADTGDGVFESRGFSMPVASALAFRGKSLIDKADVIVVAISNGDFKTDWFANFHDRRRAVEQRMKAATSPSSTSSSSRTARTGAIRSTSARATAAATAPATSASPRR